MAAGGKSGSAPRGISGDCSTNRRLCPAGKLRRAERCGFGGGDLCSKIADMNGRIWRSGLPLAAAVLLLFPSAYAQQHGRGRKYKPPPPTCNITVTVLRGDNRKPVEDAAVVFHPLKDGKNDGNMELKTNEEGKVSLDVVPVGTTLRLQVIANGFQTLRAGLRSARRYQGDHGQAESAAAAVLDLPEPSDGRRGTGEDRSRRSRSRPKARVPVPAAGAPAFFARRKRSRSRVRAG